MVQRSFIIGSKWLYYKIYTGPKSIDEILNDIVLPLVQEFESQKWIDKWFFIRYADPKNHLRLRFLVSESGSIANIMERLYAGLQPYIEQDLVWNVQLDTYNRELERYGEHTIELSESIFWIDSWATTWFLFLIEGNEGEQLRWLYGLRATDNLMTAFEYTLEEKLALMEHLKNSFGKEFNMSKSLKKQLDKKYRSHETAIAHFMTFTAEEKPEYQPILAILQDTYKNTLPIAKNIVEIYRSDAQQIPMDALMSSYIHMTMNRLFRSKNRLNEMVCYDFLYRYYKTLWGKAKKGIKF